MHPTNEQFIEKMGLTFETEGLPRISGRMLGLLLLTAGESSLDELAETLQVSKGSVSTNARLLEGVGIVEKVSRPGDRRDYYRIAEDMLRRMMEARLERMRHLRDLMVEAERTVVADDPKVYERLRAMHRFHSRVMEDIGRKLHELTRGEASEEESERV